VGSSRLRGLSLASSMEHVAGSRPIKQQEGQTPESGREDSARPILMGPPLATCYFPHAEFLSAKLSPLGQAQSAGPSPVCWAKPSLLGQTLSKWS
jgi:hypothetical protein